MKKELTDFVGSLLFGDSSGTGHEKKLHFISRKQFLINPSGNAEKEQSVITDILVDKDLICMTYLLPDGHEVSFKSAITDIDCRMNSDYTIDKIVCNTMPAVGDKESSLFILECYDDSLRFFGERKDENSKVPERTFFEIHDFESHP